MKLPGLYDINNPVNFRRKKDIFWELRLLFSKAIQKFDEKYLNINTLESSLVPVHGRMVTDLKLKNDKNEKLEEYYKWQFVYALLQSGLYSKDYVCVECHFPKGSAGAKPLKLDLAIFNSPEWKTHYNDYWKNKDTSSLDWLRNNVIAVGEFKRDNYDVDKAFKEQLKPAMKEKEPTTHNILGIFYDSGRLYLFQRKEGKFIRFDESKNQKGGASSLADLSLQLPDPYINIPDFKHCLSLGEAFVELGRGNRTIDDLDIVTSIANTQIQDALSFVLRSLDKVGLVNQSGYHVIIHALALKIFDETENDRNSSEKLRFYVSDEEKTFKSLSEKGISRFIKRLQDLEKPARKKYKRIFSNQNINWKNENHIRAVLAVCESFQDYSFFRSSSTDLYQLVFYNFASAFKRDEAAQFLTPLPIIKFIVSLVNPRGSDTVADPCVGIGDFLAMSYLNSKADGSKSLSEGNLFGVDLDESMVSLATLNLLLAGDGEAKLFHKPGLGSINSKIGTKPEDDTPTLVELNPEFHKNGAWDEWSDETELFKFDCILTNPPFGEDRAFRPATDEEKSILEMYETWNMSGSTEAMDLGVLFLENAYRSLEENGRLGIVLSNSIASVQKWEEVRQWLSKKMRIVGLFDLPSNVFAETGVNTSIIIAYKPSEAELVNLQEDGYEIYSADIQKVGYEKRTRKRNVYFNEIYKLDPKSFKPLVDVQGNLIPDEEFSVIVQGFREWAELQEETLQTVFIG